MLIGPDNQSVTIQPLGSSLIVRQATKVGQYRLQVNGQEKTVYATLRSDLESDVAPHSELALGTAQVKAVRAPARFGDFWRPAILLSLLVLAGEWWLFAKRS